MPTRLRISTPQAPGDERAELQNSAPDRFVGDADTALGKQILDISLAQREAQV
jgi:hypothetical protein